MNILRIYKGFNTNEIISDDFKKKFKSKIKVIFEKNYFCEFEASIKVTGLSNFHFSKENFTSSLDIKILDGHIQNITRFKLLLPQSRNQDNEIFTTTLLSELNFITPRTYYVDGSINGRSQKFIFQEKLAKELLERHKLREGPIYVFSNKYKLSKNSFHRIFLSFDTLFKILLEIGEIVQMLQDC